MSNIFLVMKDKAEDKRYWWQISTFVTWEQYKDIINFIKKFDKEVESFME